MGWDFFLNVSFSDLFTTKKGFLKIGKGKEKPSLLIKGNVLATTKRNFAGRNG